MNIPAILFFATILCHFACLWKIFQKAGKPAWHGFVPGLNYYTWQKITDRDWWWILILLVPGVNFFMLIIMHVQLSWSFGKRDWKETLIAIVAPYIMLPQLAFKEDIQFTGNVDWKARKKSSGREWADAILFALIAAFIIRTFIFEAFTIPTPSMEKSLRVGDFLFVSKISHGAKMPETPISFPLAHHTLPIINTKSYLEWFKMDYHRLPGWREWKRNDPMVFNFPEGDTVVANRQSESYYAILMEKAIEGYQKRKSSEGQTGSYADFHQNRYKHISQARNRFIKRDQLIFRPKDKQDNYIKRCVALPGQKFELRDRRIYIDDELTEDPEGLQYSYLARFNSIVKFEDLKEAVGGAFLGESVEQDLRDKKTLMILNLDNDGYENIQNFSKLDSIVPFERGPEPIKIFPRDYGFWDKNKWDIDNFGPIMMPARGMTIDLNLENLPLYKRIISHYEGNNLQVQDDVIYINREVATTYTFKLNYYWLMGDNRHNSLDSRYWGFVPEDHVVGKATFVWLSLDEDLGFFDGKIRWSRMFRSVD